MNIYEGNFKNNNYNIAIVASKFNEIVTHHLVDGAIASLKQFGVLEDQIDIYGSQVLLKLVLLLISFSIQITTMVL